MEKLFKGLFVSMASATTAVCKIARNAISGSLKDSLMIVAAITMIVMVVSFIYVAHAMLGRFASARKEASLTA